MQRLIYKWRALQNQPIITTLLVIINIMVFVLMSSLDSIYNTSNLISFGVLIPAEIKSGHNFISLFNSMFIHLGVEHIVFNMITLYFLGRILEPIIGHFKFLIIYLLSGLIGNIVTVAYANPYIISAGASGAIFGLIGVWLMLAVQYHENHFFRLMGRQMLLFTVLGMMGNFLGGPEVNVLAHLGGLIGGFLIAYITGFKKFGKIELSKKVIAGFGLLFLSILICKSIFIA